MNIGLDKKAEKLTKTQTELKLEIKILINLKKINEQSQQENGS